MQLPARRSQGCEVARVLHTGVTPEPSGWRHGMRRIADQCESLFAVLTRVREAQRKVHARRGYLDLAEHGSERLLDLSRRLLGRTRCQMLGVRRTRRPRR